MLIIQGVTYTLPNRDLLFNQLNLIVNKQEKINLIGHNGIGKSTLLKILAGILQPSAGIVKTDSKPYYVPQLFGQFNDYTLAQVLQVDHKLKALNEILEGKATEENMSLLDDDWSIEERCKEALAHWKLEGSSLSQKMETLSGGQKTSVFLAGIMIHRPEIVLLDEPSNHLDTRSRRVLYDYIKTTRNTVVVVSHDRTLLNILDAVYELNKQGISIYGGNYDFYTAQKAIEMDALNKDLKSKEKALRKAKETEREALERQQKLDARGRKKQEKAGLPTIVMHTLRDNAQKSTSRMKDIHAEKVSTIAQEMSQLRTALPDADKMKLDFDHSGFRKGKILLKATDLNFGYDGKLLWKPGLNFQIRSTARIAIGGLNGSGKTTLIKLILAHIQPLSGKIDRASFTAIYIDQDYSLIDDKHSVYEQAQRANSGGLQEHEVKIRLNRFLFTYADWDKPCVALSGGEKMRLMLCTLTIRHQAPDLIILDEPTNNLDIQNVNILTDAIHEYKGTLLVISHDEYFLKQINVEQSIFLN